MVKLITIVAADKHTNSTAMRTMSYENIDEFKKELKEFEKDLPYKRYELLTLSSVEDEKLINVLDEFGVDF